MRAKRRVIALLLSPLLLIALTLAYLSSWRVQVIKTAGADPFQVTFSPDGNYLAVAAHGPVSYPEHGALDFWRVVSPGFLRPAQLSNHRVVKALCPASLCFSGDSTRLVCTSYNGNGITSWDSATGQRGAASKSEDDEGYEGNFAQAWPDKNTITYWTGEKVEQRDVAQNRIKKNPGNFLTPHLDAGYNPVVAFAPSGKLMASADSAYESSNINGIQLHSANTKDTPLLPFDGCTGDSVECNPTALAFSPDSQLVIVARTRIYYRNNNVASTAHLTLLWNVATRRIAAQWKAESAINAFAFSPDGATIAEARRDGSVQLHDTASGKLLRTSQAHRHDARSVAFSPDGTLLASCGGDGTVRLTRIR